MVLVGDQQGDTEVPYLHVVQNGLRVQGRLMCENRHALQVVKPVEAGILRLGSGGKLQNGFQVRRGLLLQDFKMRLM